MHPSAIAQIHLQISLEIIIALMKGHPNETTQTRQLELSETVFPFGVISLSENAIQVKQLHKEGLF